jgi:hypothetical protein
MTGGVNVVNLKPYKITPSTTEGIGYMTPSYGPNESPS